MDKYSQKDINNLFIKSNPSVVQRTKVKVINEDWGDDNYPDNTSGKYVDSGDNVDDAIDLMDQLNNLCDPILQLLQSADRSAINTLRDHIEDVLMNSAGGEAPDESGDNGDKIFEVMQAIVACF